MKPIENCAAISLVIPCFNAARWIGRAIDSVLAQKDLCVEVLVVDDGSTDNSVDVVLAYGDRVQLTTEPNRGACAARNRGLEMASADVVMFLDADDYLEGPFLQSACKALSSRKADVAFGRIVRETGMQRVQFSLDATETPSDVMRAFLEQGFVPTCGTVWSTGFVRKIGGWKEGLRRYQDLELTYRALRNDPEVALFGEGHGVYFQHASSDRISCQTDHATVLDQAETIRFVGECLRESGLPDPEQASLMQMRAYRLWQQACRVGDPASIKVGRDLYREFGGHGHVGSLAHKVVASVLGLQAKEWLALRVAAMRSKQASRTESTPML